MKRPLVNLLSLVSGDLGSRFLGFLITVYLARVLEPSGFGIMSLGLAALGFLQLAGSAGIPILEIRNTAASDVDRERVSAVLSLRALLAAILWILIAGVAYVYLTDSLTRDVIVLFSLSVFPFALMLDWLFQGKEEFFITSSSRMVQYGVYGVLVLLVVHDAADVRWTAVAFGAGVVAQVVVLWAAYVKRWGSIRLQWSPATWKGILTKGLPVGVAMLLAQGVVNLPPLTIGYFCSPTDVGLFSAAMRLIFLMLLVDRLFNALFLPAITRYFSLQGGDVRTLVETTLRVLFILIVSLVMLGIIVGREAIPLVLGIEYEPSLSLFYVLLGYFFLTVLNSVFVCILIGSGREHRYSKMVAWGSIVLCIATVVGTKQFGALGAAFGVALGELMTVALMMGEARKVVQFSVMPILLRPLVAGACAVVTAVMLQELHTIAMTVTCIAVFVGVDLLLGGVTAKDIQFLREKFV